MRACTFARVVCAQGHFFGVPVLLTLTRKVTNKQIREVRFAFDARVHPQGEISKRACCVQLVWQQLASWLALSSPALSAELEKEFKLVYLAGSLDYCGERLRIVPAPWRTALSALCRSVPQAVMQRLSAGS